MAIQTATLDLAQPVVIPASAVRVKRLARYDMVLNTCTGEIAMVLDVVCSTAYELTVETTLGAWDWQLCEVVR